MQPQDEGGVEPQYDGGMEPLYEGGMEPLYKECNILNLSFCVQKVL